MGQAVVHFEVVGKDGEALQKFYGDLFDWKVDSDNPMNYGMVSGDDNSSKMGSGIGGGVSATQEGGPSYATFYVAVPDVGAALDKAESLGGTKMFGPERVTEQVEIGLFNDPEGNIIGVVKDEEPQG
jgi:predicted enzyme related to lactoylglutathione lyase